jgi:NAD(P)-dependent dehydrogenase (short-subunit alcohol dehydrogenase family)
VKIAITGHTAGIGAALAEAFYGEEIVGLSRRTGDNIRNIGKVADLIEPCDLFISNAQAGFAQTELLFEMHRRWADLDKRIWVISTMMTQQPVSTVEGMDEYRIQKISLELAAHQLRYKTPRGPHITVVRPGWIATQPGTTSPPAADPTTWARILVQTFRMAEANNLAIADISLGPKI